MGLILKEIIFKQVAKYWYPVLCILVVVATGWLAYHKIKRIGYDEAVTVYSKDVARRQEALDKKISNIEALSTSLVSRTDENTKSLAIRMDKVMLAVKNKPLYTVIDGKCTPSVDFVDSYNSFISESAAR